MLPCHCENLKPNIQFCSNRLTYWGKGWVKTLKHCSSKTGKHKFLCLGWMEALLGKSCTQFGRPVFMLPWTTFCHRSSLRKTTSLLLRNTVLIQSSHTEQTQTTPARRDRQVLIQGQVEEFLCCWASVFCTGFWEKIPAFLQMKRIITLFLILLLIRQMTPKAYHLSMPYEWNKKH